MTPEEQQAAAARILMLEGMVAALFAAIEARDAALAQSIPPTVERWIMSQSLRPEGVKREAVQHLQALAIVMPILH